MIIDSSALICILLREPEALQFATAISRAGRLQMAAPTWLETAMVITMRKGETGFAALQTLVSEAGISIVPWDAELASIAYAAWLSFGKGRHPAALNMGDCFSYALAKQRSDLLLYKGNDFSKTDILPALVASE